MKINQLLVCCALALSANAPASPGHPLPDSSISMKFSNNYGCNNNDCDGIIAGNYSAVHHFEIDRQILQRFDKNTVITLLAEGLEIELKLADDPTYIEGASSAKITKQVPLTSYGTGKVDVSAVVSWGDADISISVRGKFSGKSYLGPGFAETDSKRLEEVNLETAIFDGDTLITKAQAFLPLDRRFRFRDFRGWDGNTRFQGQYGFRSVQ
jgi:hypothetical protein